MTENITIVKLTRGTFAIIDEKHQDLADRHVYKWYCSKDGYAMRSVYAEGKQRKEHLHRVVLERKLGRSMRENTTTEFVNGDALDCREENLREVSWAAEVAGRKWQPPQRHQVRTGHKNPTGEKYIYRRRGGKYQVQYPSCGKMKHLALYQTLEEAVEARNRKLQEAGAWTR